jgi:hypothetical protein
MNRPERPPEPPPSVQRRAGDVIAQLGQAIRRAQMVAAVHEVDGCPTPGACPPCQAERRRWHAVEIEEYRARDASARREAVAQHAVSAARVRRHTSPAAMRAEQQRRARDAQLISRTQQIAAGARCRVCAATADGQVCRSCDPTGLASPDRHPGSRQSVSGGRTMARVPPGDLKVARAPVDLGFRDPGSSTSRPPSPGTDPLGFAAALRSLDRCPGCDERGTAGHVCESCTCLG